MKKKVFIGAGHGGLDSGAVGKNSTGGIVYEKTYTLKIALACRDVLQRHGVEVLMSRTTDVDDTLNDECRRCNEYNPDLALDIHCNSCAVPDTAAGTEVYYSLVGGTSKTLAENILDNIIKLGKVNRGTKKWKGANGLDYLGFIRMTTCPAVLVETCFINNVADQKCIETTEGQKAMGVAIAKGVLATLGIKYQEKTTSGAKPIENVSNKPESGAKTLYRVQVGAFAERKNAENMLNKLVAAGFKGFIIKIN